MAFVKISGMNDLKEGAYGILEPDISADKEIYDRATDNSLIILPGLCFDRHGNRIGYGAGFYDGFMKDYESALANDIIKSVAIGYSFQVSDNTFDDYMQNRDIPVSIVVTDEEIIRV